MKVIGTTVALALAIFAGASLDATAGDDWPMYKFSAAGDGANPEETNLSRASAPGLKLEWSGANAVPGLFSPGPVEANGVVFIGDSDPRGHGGLHAYDAASHAELWFGQTAIGTKPGFIASAAAVADGMVYVVAGCFACASQQPVLHAFNATGCGAAICSPVWSRDFTNDGAIWTPLTVDDGVIYLGTLTTHRLYAISAATQAVLWTANVAAEGVYYAPAVAHGMVYVALPNEGIHAYPAGCRTDGGECPELWSDHTHNGLSMPAVDGANVYVSGTDGSLHAYAAAGCGASACSPAWSVSVTPSVNASLGPPSVAGDIVYVGYMDSSTLSGKVVAVSAVTHGILWTSTVDTGFIGSIAIANGVVYATSSWDFDGTNYLGATYAFPTTCESSCGPIWTGPARGQRGANTAVAGGVVYVTAPTGFDAYKSAESSLVIEPSPIEFRDQRVDAKPDDLKAGSVEVTLRNGGPVTVTVTGVATVLGPASEFYGKGQRACFRAIAPGDTCTFTMLFKPATLGDRQDILQIFDDAPDSPQTTKLHGKGAKGKISIEPGAVLFADQRVGKLNSEEFLPKGQTVAVHNTGTVPVKVTEIATTLGQASDFYGRDQHACTRELDPAELCQFTMYFKPKALGDRSDTLEVTDEDDAVPTTASLRGRGVLGTLLIEPTPIAFKDQRVGKQTRAELAASAQTVELQNAGQTSIKIASIATAQATSDFYGVGQNACERLLDPNEVCRFTMYFKPSVVGLREDTLQIFDDQGQLLKTAPLRGTGAVPTVTVSPTTLVFPGTLVNTTTILPVLVTNTGTVPVDFGNHATRITGAAFDEALAPDTCVGTIEAQATCTVNVAFTPRGPGAKAGVLLINDDAEPNPQVIPLVGIGIRP